MQEVRRGEDRGYADHGWLRSFHSFSFAEYYDPDHVEFGVLRVINEDRVHPGRGFGAHSHRDMEIISYVLEGELEHRDSMGTSSVIRPGDVQRLSAGTGVTHSEQNASREEIVHFLQIWIQPSRLRIPPSYEQKAFPAREKRGRLRLVVSPDGREGSVRINQDAQVFAGLFTGGESAVLLEQEGRRRYVHVVKGELTVNDTRLAGGDALKVASPAGLSLAHGVDAEVLVFDLPD